MTDKELLKLSKTDLLDIIRDLLRKNQSLEKQVGELKEKLTDRGLKIARAGSIAEAALAVNGVMEAAQAAADQYLEQIKQLYRTAADRSVADPSSTDTKNDQNS